MVRKFVLEGVTVPSAPAASLEERYEQATRCGSVCIGDEYLFIPGMLQVRCIPLLDIVWAYMRQEDSTASICCGRTSIPSYFLLIVTADHGCKKIPFDSPNTIRAVLSVLQEKNPAITVGYSEQLAQQFAVS